MIENFMPILEMREECKSYKEIAEVLGITVPNVCAHIQAMKRKGIDITTTFKWTPYRVNRLLDMREAGLTQQQIANSLETTINVVKRKCSLLVDEGATIRRNSVGNSVNSMVAKNEAILYLLDFNEFWKYGITQTSIAKRFSGSPSYTIVDSYVDEVSTIVSMEQEIKYNVRDYKFVPEHKWFANNGKTECFIPFRKSLRLLDLIS